VVGAIEGFAYEGARIRLNAGDMLFIFTDGITEARNERGELFSEGRLKAFLEAQGAPAAADLVAAIREEVRLFAGASPASDDLTVMVVRYGGPSPEVETPSGGLEA